MWKRLKIAVFCASFVLAVLELIPAHAKPIPETITPELMAEAMQQPNPLVIQGTVITHYATTSGNGAMDMLPAPATGLRNYITQVYCVNTGATKASALIKDGSTTIGVVPCGTSSALDDSGLLQVRITQPSTATKLTMTSTASASTNYFYMGGYTR